MIAYNTLRHIALSEESLFRRDCTMALTFAEEMSRAAIYCIQCHCQGTNIERHWHCDDHIWTVIQNDSVYTLPPQATSSDVVRNEIQMCLYLCQRFRKVIVVIEVRVMLHNENELSPDTSSL